MDAETLLLETEESMLKAVDFAKQEFSGVRTGKASPGLVENLDVHVSSYGSVMKLKGLAVISTPEPRLILIQPFDPSTVHDIGRAINESKLNLNPLVEGRSIRLPIPALTEERRKDLVKLVKSQAEEARVRVRGARKAAMDSAKKLKAENIVTEDGQRDLETQGKGYHDHLNQKHPHPQPFDDNDRQRNQLPRLRHRDQGNHPFPE